MTAQRGDMVQLSISDGGDPESFALVGGARLTAMEVQNIIQDNSGPASGMWRSSLSEAGIRQMVIHCEGLFTDSSAEALVRSAAFLGEAHNYKVAFGNGDSLTGAFVIRQYEKHGEYGREEQYALQLQSAGPIIYSVGA